jgi:hypothetical protein
MNLYDHIEAKGKEHGLNVSVFKPCPLEDDLKLVLCWKPATKKHVLIFFNVKTDSFGLAEEFTDKHKAENEFYNF